MKLIDADALKKHYSWWNDGYKEIFDNIIDQQPTIEERKKGKWIYKSSLGWGESWVCSECGERTVSSIMGEPRFNYCPMCGLKMSKGEEDETDRR